MSASSTRHKILMRQANVLRTYAHACGGVDKLPKTEAWDHFPPFVDSVSDEQRQVLQILRL